jgi:hypothetical protein
VARAKRRKSCPPNRDNTGRPLRVGDVVKVELYSGGVKIAANEGYPSRGVITKWDGCNVAEVRAPKAKTIRGYPVNWAPGGRYSISTSNLTRTGRARKRR